MKSRSDIFLISLTTVAPLAEVSDVILSYILGGYWGSSGYFSNPPFFVCLFGKNLVIVYFRSLLCRVSRGTACSARSLNACLSLK